MCLLLLIYLYLSQVIYHMRVCVCVQGRICIIKFCMHYADFCFYAVTVPHAVAFHSHFRTNFDGCVLQCDNSIEFPHIPLQLSLQHSISVASCNPQDLCIAECSLPLGLNLHTGPCKNVAGGQTQGPQGPQGLQLGAESWQQVQVPNPRSDF